MTLALPAYSHMLAKPFIYPSCKQPYRQLENLLLLFPLLIRLVKKIIFVIREKLVFKEINGL